MPTSRLVSLVIRFASLCFALFAPVCLAAQTSTFWLGGGTNWHDPFAWSAGVPTSRVAAVINTGPNYPTINQDAACGNLTVGSTGLLTIAAGARLDVNGNATATRTVLGGGLVRIADGSSTAAVVTGNFQALEFARVAGGRAGRVQVAGAVSVSAGTLEVLSGCRFGTLTVQPRGVVTVNAGNTDSLIVDDSTAIMLGASLANSSGHPVLLGGRSHRVDGAILGSIQLQATGPVVITAPGALGEIRLAAPASLVLDGMSRGQCGRIVTAAQPTYVNASLRDVTYHPGQSVPNLRYVNLSVSGHVTMSGFLYMQDAGLSGDETAELDVPSITCGGNAGVGPAPGTIRTGGISVGPTNNFRPVRGTVILEGGRTVVDGLFGSFAGVVARGSVSIELPSGATMPLYLGQLIVDDGASCTLTGCRVAEVGVETTGRLTSSLSTMGSTTVFGEAFVGVSCPLGDASMPAALEVKPGGAVIIVPEYSGPGQNVWDVTAPIIVGRDAALRLAQNSNGSAGLHILSGGRLTLDGTPTEPAVIAGNNSSIQIDGEVVARGFRITGMDAAGVRILAGARFGNPADPRNFQGGHFTGGQSGGVLLHLERAQTTRLWDIDFDNTGGATRNVRCGSGSAITFVDSRGNLAGEAFDDDPGARVSFNANATAVVSLAATPQIYRNSISFVSSVEDTSAFRVLRLPATGLAPLSALGASTRYTSLDDGLLAGTRLSYRVQRQRWSPLPGAGEWQNVGTATVSAEPHARDEGNTRFVGPNGYPDIGAALAGAPTGATVHVQAGTYPGFAITRPVRILAAASASVSGPVSASYGGAIGELLLEGLSFGSNASLTLTDLAVPVLVGRCTSSASPAMTITRCPKVALQRVTASSPVALTTAKVHAWNCSLGTVQAQQNSQFVRAGGSANVQVDATSTSTIRNGPTATLSVPTAWPSGVSQTLSVSQGSPGLPYGVLLGISLDHLDVSPFLPYDMRLLIPLSEAFVLISGTLDSSGRASLAIPGPPNASAAGGSVLFQLFTFDLATSQGRLGEARPAVFLR